MAVFKISFFILCYFCCRIALSACEPYSRTGSNANICWDEKNHAYISERCLSRDCDAKKFLSQYKASKVKVRDNIASAKACEELQIPAITMSDTKGKSQIFCLFNDGSILDAAVVERLVL